MAEYCSRCGEKRRDHADWKLSRMGVETFAEITDIEHSKLWQTLGLLVFKPGQLTREYWSGRRKRFLGPVKLYLVFGALFLVLHYIHQPTASYDVRGIAALFDRLPVEQREQVMKIWQSRAPGRFPRDSTGELFRLLDELANKRGLPTTQFTQEVNARWQSYISMSQFAYPLVVALALKLLLRRRGLYFAQHLIFALHALAFIFLSSSLLWPFKVLFGIQTSFYTIVSTVFLTWPIVYCLLALRRAYAEPWLAAVIKGCIVFLIFFATYGFLTIAMLALALT